MKYLPLVFLIFIIASCSDKKPSVPEQINIGTVEKISSKILDEERKVWVYVPGGVENSLAEGKKYPVVYLLDGDTHFDSVVGMVHQLSSMNGNSVCPEMIIVAILNTDRTRDLTPTQMYRNNYGEFPTSGGGETFTKFISGELIPYIDSKYPTTSYRTLIGHSFGGLFAINTFVHHNDLFSNYLAIDPSLWWDGGALRREAEAMLDIANLRGKTLFVTIANTMRKGMKVDEVEKDTAIDTSHIRNVIGFCKAAKTKTNNGLLFDSKYYEDDSHGSVPLISTYDALHFWFPWYKMDVDEFFNKSSGITPEEITKAFEDHYQVVSDHYGFTVKPPRHYVHEIGNYLLYSKYNDRAFACFNLNLVNYPDHKDTYQDLGDYFAAVKDSTSALENYKKAFAIGEDDQLKKKIASIAKKQAVGVKL